MRTLTIALVAGTAVALGVIAANALAVVLVKPSA